MNLLENYEKAVESLSVYFEYENFGWYAVDMELDSYWSATEETVGWAEKIEDFETEDGEYYEEEFQSICRAEEFTAVLIKYNRELYWKIFSNNKEK